MAPNTVLPWGAETERPDYDYAQGLTLRVFALDDGASASFTVASPQGGIAVSLTAKAVGSGWRLRFEVQDSGIGVPADRLDRLFKSPKR